MSEIHRMALAAATGVVGRHRHRVGAAAIGLVLGGAGATGCVIVKVPGDQGSASEASSEGSEATGSSGLTSSGALSDATGMGGSSGEATTSASTGTGEGSTSTDATGSGDATTGSSSSGGDSDASSGSGSGTGTDSDGELDTCIDENGEVDWVCCEAQNWQPPEHCTPWGPPAPPRMVRAPARGRLV
ncbi:MAG: hypothetical protein KC420_16505 [Myxococcales bacterium]|nr:hypothetical protein [Myxococcales bacterium]MCB9566445.1 hypothetical protein [Myxococcales bacterium]MCB9705701.1 hypothetical protein [Myxococcales bacterium]